MRHVQHAYFSSLDQSNSQFVMLSLWLKSRLLKLHICSLCQIFAFHIPSDTVSKFLQEQNVSFLCQLTKSQCHDSFDPKIFSTSFLKELKLPRIDKELTISKRVHFDLSPTDEDFSNICITPCSLGGSVVKCHSLFLFLRGC